MPMMRSLDTIFNGLANTYRQQGSGETRAVSESPQDQGDESREGTPAFAATGRLFPRDAEGPQPMNRSVDSLNEYVALSFPMIPIHGGYSLCMLTASTIVFLNSSGLILVDLAGQLEVVEFES